jgi:hypothetical protein
LIFKCGYGGAIWKDVAFYTLAGSIVGALIAALPGFVDLTGLTNPKTRTIAILMAATHWRLDKWIPTLLFWI